MPTDNDRAAFEEAIKRNYKDQICAFLQRDDAKELLMMKREAFGFAYFPIHEACWFVQDTSCLQLILDAAVKHGIVEQMLQLRNNHGQTCLHFACRNTSSTDSLRPLRECLLKHTDMKQMLEEKDKYGSTCLHTACENKLPPDSLRLLLEFMSEHTDIKKMLEEKSELGSTCLHAASVRDLSPDSLRLLISFFPSKNLLSAVLDARDFENKTPVDRAKNDKVKQLLQDPDCFEKCRLWLLQNHEDTFLYLLFPNSFEKSCDALKELTKIGLQETPGRLTIMLIAFMPSPSKFREAVDKTDSSAPMSSYFDAVKKGDKKSDYNHWRKNINRFRDFSGQWPPSERRTAITYEGEDSSSCSIQ